MAKRVKTERVRFRTAIQLFVAAASNSWVTGFAAGKIYQGNLKQLCHPGLNCYSCPGALLSCPIGALQAVIGSRSFDLSLYVCGFLLAVGATLYPSRAATRLTPVDAIRHDILGMPLGKSRPIDQHDIGLQLAQRGQHGIVVRDPAPAG